MALLSNKNPTPSQLALLTAAVIAAGNASLSVFVLHSPGEALIVLAGTFLVTYLLYRYTLQRFIYRKLKLIYKLIYQTKATKREEFFYNNILPQKTIDEVSEDVASWAVQRAEEIAVLQANESFRKEFLSNLAHELRTPVFNIQGYVDTLLGGALEDESVNRKFLSNAAKSVDRLARLLDDLDEITQLETRALPLNKSSFIIQDVIRDVYEELSLRADESGTRLDFKKGTRQGIEVQADREKIRQVLVNLVENALKYGNRNGTISAGCYQVDGAHVYVEISDDGPGIAEQHLPRIFERFYRADRSRQRSIGGTGLGLAIVKHIIEAHGHTATVRSTPGVGSSFGFTLDRG